MNNNGTLIQKIFWSISGNEVWIIKDCPTAHKYYSRQGLLFVMTFFFAAFCGAFAGEDFGGSAIMTLLIGFIWGLLVYSIDQMMIQTIDKVYVDTISTKSKFLKYIFPRMFLGCLLAMFMSSPLDHYLFSGQIEHQRQKNADKEWMSYQNELNNAMDIEGTKNRQNNNQLSRENLSKLRSKNPTTIAFHDAITNYDIENPKLSQLARIRANSRAEMNQSWNRIPERYDEITNKSVKIIKTSEYETYLTKKRAYTNAITDYVRKEKEVNNYAKIMIEERQKYEKELNEKIQRQDTIIFKLTKKIENDNATVANDVNNKRKFLGEMQGFDTKFMTLLTHPNFGVQFLRWFIFLVFLLIEIIPTWMKIMGKPTEYDVKLDIIRKTRIKEFELIVKQDEQIADIKNRAEIQITKEKENQRQLVELDLHKKILDEILNKYENLSKSILQDWEDNIKLEQKLKYEKCPTSNNFIE